MRFLGTLLVLSIMLLLGIASLILFMLVHFPRHYLWIEGTLLGVGLFLFISAFHELCHLVALFVTHNQDIVIGLTLSHLVLGIRYEGQVPSRDASMIYLSSLMTLPAGCFAFYLFSIKFWSRFLPAEFALPISIAMALSSLPFTFAMSKMDISDWRRLRNKDRR